ncbi:ABC transporter permease subunit [candidate division KSB3 bacterium]|uniref:ABC transporter permease subunit n=1 Tax=candidate division KSB3 bacterium TaxID=2044937 RepID=A0A9D5JWD5_9BACT|nr:ABC transporter permease subunit [candidate division KSB3 bacterium]MBD3325340.1 ABC transporter permease subunit [candidate division KSB3 bacterium]
MSHERFKKKLTLVGLHAILLFGCVIVLFPLLWILRTSFAHRVIAYQIPPQWIFTPTFANYVTIFREEPFHLYFANSLIVALASTLVCLLIGAPAAFSYSRFRTGGNALRVSMLATQMLPAITLVIPFFLIFKSIGLYNTRTGLVLTYITFNMPFIMWIMISFFQGIPRELDDSAQVDGCTRFSAFLRVIVPISLPGMLSAGVFSFVLSWNEFLFALILTGKNSKTLPVAVSGLITQQGTQIGAVCAAVVVIILPMILLYFGFRTFLIKGIVAGAVKE